MRSVRGSNQAKAKGAGSLRRVGDAMVVMEREVDRERTGHRLVYVGRSSMEMLRRYRGRLRRLREEGFQVDIYAGDDGGREELEAEGIGFHSLPVKSPRNPAGLLGAYLILQGTFLENPPLLVHVFGHRLATLAVFAAREAKVRAVFATLEYHWVDEPTIQVVKSRILRRQWREKVEDVEAVVNQLVGPRFRKTMEEHYRWLGREVDCYLVATEFDYRFVEDMDLVEPEKLEFVLGGAGVEVENYSEGGKEIEKEAARRQLGLPREWRQVVGWFSPLTGRHGGEELLAIIREISSRHPAVGWVVGLRGEESAGLRRRLRRRERKGVVWVKEGPTLEEERRMMVAADLLAWSGSPSTPHDPILEAMGAGVPIVGYDTPTVRGLLRQWETGVLVDEGDRKGLERGLEAALGDPRRLREMGVRLQRDGAMRFERSQIDERVLRLYAQVMEAAMREG